MKRNLIESKRIAFAMLLFWCCNLSLRSQVTTQTFVFTGTSQSFVVPPCVSSISLDVKGAQGGPNNNSVTVGGLGGSATGVINVTQGDVLNIYVGGSNGYNGGGLAGVSPCTLAMGGVGGGASDIRLNGNALSNRVIVGGGGGGGGGDRIQGCGRGTGGGGGGGYYGGGGGAGWGNSTIPTGGTQSAGGSAGLSGTTAYNGVAGLLGVGGAGGIEISSSQAAPNSAMAGGSGGGLTGSSGQWSTNFTGQSGAGGSSYVGTLTNTTTASGVRAGNGIVVISYVFSGVLTNASASPAQICTGSSATLSSGGQVSYTWSPGGSNGTSIVVTPTSTTNYTVQGTNNLGCVSLAVITVSVDATVPSLSVSSTATTLCAGKTAIFTASGANSYTWTNGITNGITYTPVVTSTYVVTGQNSCGTSTAAISVSVNPTPTITASINNPTVCSGNTIILNGGGGVGTYTWSPSVGNNTPFVPPNTGLYTVTGAGANSCTSTAVVGVTVLITPTVAPVVTPTAMCLGGTATLSAVGATGYTWSPGTLPNAPTVTVSPPIPTTYTVTRTNGACSSTSTVNLVIYPLPLVNASASPSQICTGTGVNMVVVGPITNTWVPGGFTQSNFTVFPNFSTNYTVTGSNGNCTLSVVVPIVVNPNPTISITSSTNTICQGAAVSLNLNAGANNGPLTFTWLPSGNSNNTTETLSPPTSTIVSVSATNSLNCVSTQQQLIVVNQLPNMGMSSSLPFICAGNSAVLTMTNPSLNVIYNWSTGQVGTSIAVNPVVTTNYISIGTNTQTGCQNTNTITMSVFISTFVVSSPTAICKGQTATLTASGPASSYLWTNVNGGTTAPSVTVAPVTNTTYSVTGTNGNCQNTQTVPLIVNPLPNVTAVAAKSQICRFEVSTINGSGASTYSWNTGATSSNISFTLSITTTYTLTGTDLNGCSKTVTVTQFVATCIGIDEAETHGQGIRIYPNPNQGSFNVSAMASTSLVLVNALGELIMNLDLLQGQDQEIKVDGLAPGVYFLAPKNQSGPSKKIVVER